jgi:hypothetical protein
MSSRLTRAASPDVAGIVIAERLKKRAAALSIRADNHIFMQSPFGRIGPAK